MALPQPTVLDVDTGLDDALALLLALRSPEINVVGVTTVAGNVTLPDVLRNTRHVLDTASATGVPVAAGTAAPLVRPLTTATFFHGPHGLGDVDVPEPTRAPVVEPAAQLLCQLAAEYRGQLTVIATGPWTNIALASRLDPEFAGNLRQLVLMGGAVTVSGNVTPVAEANVYNDPEAAHMVLASGAMPEIIGLDVTLQALWRPAEQETARQRVQEQSAADPVARLAVDLLDWYLRADLAVGLAGSPLHDPVAVAAAMWPGLFTLEPRHVSVELASELTRGQTVAAPEGRRERLETREGNQDVVGVETVRPNCQVALKLDGDRFVDGCAARLGLL